MSQRIMMSGARITLQEGRLLGWEGGYPSNETGQPCRAAAQRGGTGMGSGVTLPGVRILAPQLHRLVTWGETTHLPELLVPQIQEGGEYSIPGWVTGTHQRKSPGL